jgi:hypothetical protein
MKQNKNKMKKIEGVGFFQTLHHPTPKSTPLFFIILQQKIKNNK